MAMELALSVRNYNCHRLRGSYGESMLIYRFLSGEDDSAFCHKVTKALSEGWSLHGSPTYAYDQMSKKMRCD